MQQHVRHSFSSAFTKEGLAIDARQTLTHDLSITGGRGVRTGGLSEIDRIWIRR
jgi:hypothetical protein